MQGRSWMAALTLVASILTIAGRPAHADDPTASRKVALDLAIDGLGAKGCEIEIKPGHPGCQFRAGLSKYAARAGNPYHVDKSGKETIELDDVRTTSADRDCVFAITIREPGQAPQTIHRGLRLANLIPGKPAPVQTLTCYFRSPSKLARANESRMRK